MATKSSSPSTTSQPRVFLSYARKDGEEFARELRQKLIKEKFSLWQDRTEMEGWKDWWDQITEALKTVEYMVLVMTETALASPIVRKEWRQARQEGVGVVPVFGQPNLDLLQLPRWMREVHWVNTEVPEQWTRFIRTLESPHKGTRVPFMADDLPAGYVLRPKEFEELAGSLLDREREEPIAITAALKGAGGYGKTTLAKALCHDERIQDAFHDGILWVTLGEQPNTMAGLTKLYAALTEERPNFVDEEDASTRLAEVLGDKDYLMVIDDVWNAAHLRPFLRGGKRCARIITTRDSATLPETAKLRVPVDAMQRQEASTLLAFDLPEGETAAFQALAAQLGEWPFLLKLVNGTLRDRVNTMRQPLPGALAYVQKALDKRGLTAFDARNPVERHQAVAITLGASFEHLKEDELARYEELAIFPEDAEIPLTAITKLWSATGGLGDFDTEELCTRLNQLSLVLRYDPTTQRIQLHDVVRTYLEQQIASQLPTLHGQFLDTYDLKDEPDQAARDPYLCRHLAHHLIKANRREVLQEFLLSIDWISLKLQNSSVSSLITDFEFLSDDIVLRLIQGAIRLSSHILTKDPMQLRSQLIGRLLDFQHPEIRKFLLNVREIKESRALFPLDQGLVTPGGALFQTLEGHSGWVGALAVTSDGQRIISGSRDKQIKVWDLKLGKEIFSLIGHKGTVNSVAIGPNSRLVVSGSDDRTVRIWDLIDCQEKLVLTGHKAKIWTVAVTPDGRKVISGSEDGTIKMWNLINGEEILELNGHKDIVTALSPFPCSKRLISGSADKSLIVWNLETGNREFTLLGHDGWIGCVSISRDGLWAISGSGDKTVKIWSLSKKMQIFSLIGHTASILGITVTSDGSYIVSGSMDHTIKVWDLKSGKEIRTLSGHVGGTYSVVATENNKWLISGGGDKTLKVWSFELLDENIENEEPSNNNLSIHSIALTSDGKQVLSTGMDRTITLWDVKTRNPIRKMLGHNDSVNAVRVSANGLLAASGADDCTIRIWNLLLGQEEKRLGGHTEAINSVGISGDGSRAISGSSDKSIRVWDLNLGFEEFKLIDHSDVVNSVAITPNGRWAISGSDDLSVRLWDLEYRIGKVIFSTHQDSVWAVDITPDGNWAISGSGDGTMKIWDLFNLVEKDTLEVGSGLVTSVLITPDAKYAVSLLDVQLSVWDLAKKVRISTYTGDRPFSCCICCSQCYTLVAGDFLGRLHFFKFAGTA